MSLLTELSSLATRVATECKTIYGKIAGNSSGDLSGLTTTTKTSLLAAVNELVTSISGKVSSSAVGAANGVASLDSGGKVPSSQLPSYVDDVLEFADAESFPETGETSKIYVALDSNHIYRWSGSAYIDMTGGSGGVASFNSRTGAVVPASGDYDAFYYTQDEIGDPDTDLVGVFEDGLE
jgi:hypothetical protein